jgi:hypothetical protein
LTFDTVMLAEGPNSESRIFNKSEALIPTVAANSQEQMRETNGVTWFNRVLQDAAPLSGSTHQDSAPTSRSTRSPLVHEDSGIRGLQEIIPEDLLGRVELQYLQCIRQSRTWSRRSDGWLHHLLFCFNRSAFYTGIP